MSLRRTFILRGPAEWKGLTGFLKQNAAAMAQQGKPLAVTVSEHKAKRNSEQNARYWALLQEIAEQAFVGGRRFTSETWHEFFARTYIGCDELPDGGLKAISTTTLNVAQFSLYMDKVEAHAARELGVQFTADEIY